MRTNDLVQTYKSGRSEKDYLQQNTQFVVRVETSCKLNLNKKDGSKLIADSDLDKPEVHFIVFEGVVDDHHVSFFSLFKTLWMLRNPLQLAPKDGKWKIVDFDHFMLGNPHECFTEKDILKGVKKGPTFF